MLNIKEQSFLFGQLLCLALIKNWKYKINKSFFKWFFQIAKFNGLKNNTSFSKQIKMDSISIKIDVNY